MKYDYKIYGCIEEFYWKIVCEGVLNIIKIRCLRKICKFCIGNCKSMILKIKG